MRKNLEFTKEDYDLINEKYAELEPLARKRCANEREYETVRKAFDFANQAHKNVRRRSGEPYMLHPIAVAEIVVSDIGLGYKSMCAALLHDVVEDTEYTVEDIRSLFGEKISSLVDGLTKLKTVLDNEDKNKSVNFESLQAENFKRILLTMNDDVRVVLIKLADRLHNCRTIEFMPEHKRDKILSETMFIFIPLAHRLGLYEIKSEMENIWLRYKEPDAYKQISDRINANVNDKESEIDSFIKPIDNALKHAGFDFSIKKRVKTPYSIWHKMETKNVTFDQIYDLYAVRIIFNSNIDSGETERDQCYHIFSIITSIYRYQPERIRDWVMQPKSNGYEALHCTLMSNSGIWIEVQIRTKRMDDIAEKGIAAHWAYKREGYINENDSEMDRWLSTLKDILVQKGDINAIELMDIFHNDLASPEITVFTPKGEQKNVAKGATALDFAYSIHTQIGNKAIAAKVNMKLVPLSTVLKTGDQVEIITAELGQPSEKWLDFLKTRKARSRVMDYFKLNSQNISTISRQHTDAQPKGDSAKTGGHIIIATCCCPIPGDPIIGFKAPDGTVTIHKKSCSEAQSIASKHGEWVVIPEWSYIAENSSFLVKIFLRGIDRVGMVNDITKCISLVMGVNMKRLNLGSDEGIFEGNIEMFVQDKTILDNIIEKLKTIDGIQSVVRTAI